MTVSIVDDIAKGMVLEPAKLKLQFVWIVNTLDHNVDLYINCRFVHAVPVNWLFVVHSHINYTGVHLLSSGTPCRSGRVYTH